MIAKEMITIIKFLLWHLVDFFSPGVGLWIKEFTKSKIYHIQKNVC